MTENQLQLLAELTDRLYENYTGSPVPLLRPGCHLPSRKAIIRILDEVRVLLFPGYFDDADGDFMPAKHFIGYHLASVEHALQAQITLAMSYGCTCASLGTVSPDTVSELTHTFLSRLPEIQRRLLLDVQAGYDGDPAAASKEEVIFSYPGFYAIFVHRVAHELFTLSVPYIPRMMSEYAHSQTGIDIHPGATIGDSFFIDHGTGVVIGETTVIGNHVKLYQGVTLGALSLRAGQKLAGKKRHPTVEDGVTVYSGASILGGDTVIGEGSVIGGNAFITASVPRFTKVSVMAPALEFRPDARAEIKADTKEERKDGKQS